MGKVTTIEMSKNEIVSSIQKLELKNGDILFFNIRTDDQGIPQIDIDVVNQTAEMLSKILEEKKVEGLFLFDKICLFSIEDLKGAKKKLEECISYIQEAMDKVVDIENGKSEESFSVIDMKIAEGLV